MDLNLAYAGGDKSMWIKVSRRLIYQWENARTSLAARTRALIDFIPGIRKQSAIAIGAPGAVARVRIHSDSCSICMRLNTWLMSGDFWSFPS